MHNFVLLSFPGLVLANKYTAKPLVTDTHTYIYIYIHIMYRVIEKLGSALITVCKFYTYIF